MFLSMFLLLKIRKNVYPITLFVFNYEPLWIVGAKIFSKQPLKNYKFSHKLYMKVNVELSPLHK